jgi:hypothetical protein
MTLRRQALILLGLAACSDITATSEGVATLLLEIPSPALVEVGETIGLMATPLDANGEVLTVPVYWIALDTTIAVDSAAGRLTGLIPNSTGRVVARTGDLYSSILSFSVLERADTLFRAAAEEDTVEVGESESGILDVELDGGDPPAPLTGRVIVYQVIHPVFSAPEERTVDLTGGGLVQATKTTSAGSTSPGVRLRRRDGYQAPDSAVVTASAWRPGGESIPGSGVRFIVRFVNP